MLVVGLSEAGLQGLPEEVEAAYQRRLGTGVADLATSVGAKAAAGTTRTLPAVDGGPRLVVTGLGEGLPDAETVELAGAVGRQRDGRADLTQLLGLLVEVDLHPRTGQCDAEGEAADPGSGSATPTPRCTAPT